jgi:glycosyltransferase involved in cell wall biosynthesis
MAAAILCAKIVLGTKTCQILPDFPEYMGEGGILYRIVKRIESRIFYYLAKRIDHFVVLTPFMADRLGLDTSRFCVVEGMAYIDPADNLASLQLPKGPNRIFLYTGTLAARYGILDLLNAFSQIEGDNVQLWICGDGDSRTVVQQFAERDQRITYFGQVPRRRAVELQQQAHILVNPRPPNGEYTKYSFPSKTIEYLASARPIVMHRLPGVPSDYFPHIIAPTTPDAAGLSSALRRAAEMSYESLQEMGLKGREFVVGEKSPEKQCMKILRMLQAT